MNEIIPFNSGGNQVRVVMIDGKPWFVAKDVIEGVGATWKGSQTIAWVPEEWRGYRQIGTPSGDQEMAILSFEGLCIYLGRSNKPAAMPYQKFIAGEVMPSIKDKGGYLAPRASGSYLQALHDDDLFDEMKRRHRQLIQQQETLIDAKEDAEKERDEAKRETARAHGHLAQIKELLHNEADIKERVGKANMKRAKELRQAASGMDQFTLDASDKVLSMVDHKKKDDPKVV